MKFFEEVEYSIDPERKITKTMEMQSNQKHRTEVMVRLTDSR